MRTVHTSISDGSMPFGFDGKEGILVSDHDHIAGSMLCHTLGASVVVSSTEHTVWAVTPEGEKNLYRLLTAQHDGGLEGCVVGSGVGGILPILAGNERWVTEFLKKVSDAGGEGIIEIPPTISPEAYRKIAKISPQRLVPSLFYHGGGPAHLLLSRPSRHQATRFLLPRHPLDDVLQKNSQHWTERLRYSARLCFPQVSEDDLRRFYARYGRYDEINLYGEWLPLVVIATRFIEALREAGVVCNLRGSGGASHILRDAFGFPPPEEGLSIERFVSPRRKSPPDVDIDVEDREKALSILNRVCTEMGLKCYRLATYANTPQGTKGFPAPAGCLIVPRDFPVPLLPDQPQEGLPVAQIPSSLADSMPVCKIDVLQVDSLRLVSYLGLDVAQGYRLREVPVPRTHYGLPHLRSELGQKILQVVGEQKRTLTLKDVVAMICMERPGLVRFIPYLLKRHLGIAPPEHVFPGATQQPSGRVFLFQEAMIGFVAKRLGEDAAEFFRKEIKKSRSPSPRLLEMAEKLGIELSSCRYLYNLAHARSYAAVLMLFAQAMHDMPERYFRFWYEVAGEKEKDLVVQEAKKYGVHLEQSQSVEGCDDRLLR